MQRNFTVLGFRKDVLEFYLAILHFESRWKEALKVYQELKKEKKKRNGRKST